MSFPPTYTEIQLAIQMAHDDLAEKAIVDPVWGALIKRIVLEYKRDTAWYDKLVQGCEEKGKDPNRNKEVAIQWQARLVRQEDAYMVIDAWLNSYGNRHGVRSEILKSLTHIVSEQTADQDTPED